MECLLAAVILTLAVCAALIPLVMGQTDTAYALHTQQAVRLAEEKMDRVLACPYAQVVSTYNGSTENPGQLKDVSGTLYPAPYQQYKRVVAAQASSQTVAALGGSITGLSVSVTVQDSDATAWVVSRFIPQ
jgi:type II secretory pathway pseudopilin PulG